MILNSQGSDCCRLLALPVTVIQASGHLVQPNNPSNPFLDQGAAASAPSTVSSAVSIVGRDSLIR